MSKQYNKAEKRQRRQRYLKRRKIAAKAKPPADPRALLTQYGCIACHAVDKKVVGPVSDNPIEGMFWNIDQWGVKQ